MVDNVREARGPSWAIKLPLIIVLSVAVIGLPELGGKYHPLGMPWLTAASGTGIVLAGSLHLMLSNWLPADEYDSSDRRVLKGFAVFCATIAVISWLVAVVF